MNHMNSSISSHFTNSDDLKIHYLSAGEGAPLVMLHGWPTSSYLWRNVLPSLAESRWVIAPDLPGFGRSDKPLDVRYSVNFYVRTLDTLLNELGIQRLDLVVHDLGGPIGLLWAVRNPGRIRRLIILNTVIYPEVSFWVKLFFLAARVPGLKQWMVSPSGVAAFIRFGTVERWALPDEVVAAYQFPFATPETRQALYKAITELNPRHLKEVGDNLAKVKAPIRIIYGKKDWLIPSVATDLHRLKAERPDIQLTTLPDCGHFLQEDQPETLTRLLLEFLDGQVE
jgi:haloalkane dehalogenase